MACCVFLAQLITSILELFRRPAKRKAAPVATRPRRRAGLLIGVAVELAAAAVLVVLWGSGGPRMADLGHDGGDSHAGMSHMDTSAGPGWILVAVGAAWFFWAALCSVRRLRPWWVLALTGLGGLAAFAPVVLQAAGRSHLVTMAVIEVVTVFVPLLIFGSGSSPVRPAPQWIRTALTVASIGLAGFLVVLHLPQTAPVLIDGAGLRPWVVVAGLALGFVYWAAVRRTDFVGRLSPVVLFPLETGAVLGLASIAGFQAHSMAAPGALSGAADGRLAGAVMLVACFSAYLTLRRRVSPADGSRAFPARSLNPHALDALSQE